MQRFEVMTSELVYFEASFGDPEAAKARLAKLTGLPSLSITADAERVANALLSNMALPRKAQRDALHVGICAVNGIEYLLTWNCQHLANAMMARRIRSICEAEGFRAPVICTPPELEGAL